VGSLARGYTSVLAVSSIAPFVDPEVGSLMTLTCFGLKVFSLMSYDCKKSLRISLSLCLSDNYEGVTASLGLLKFNDPVVLLKSSLIGASSAKADFVFGRYTSFGFGGLACVRSGRILIL